MKYVPALGAQNYNHAKNLLKRKLFVRYCKPRVDLIREMVKFAGLKGNEKILDAGCGNGDDLIQLRQRHKAGGELRGVDVSETMIALARRSNKKRKADIDFSIGDITRLAFPDEHFDLVMLKHVLHNIPDYQKALRECHRVLKRGGRLIVAVNSRKTMLVLRRLRPKIARLLKKNFFIDSDLHLNIENIAGKLQPPFADVQKRKFESLIVLKNAKPYLEHLDSGKDFWGVDAKSWQKVMDFSKNYLTRILKRNKVIRDSAIVGLAKAVKS